MMQEQFFELAREIRAAHDLRPPTETQARIWWEICGNVPWGNPSRWIRQQLLEAESCPRNLGGAILHLWAVWRDTHPEQCVPTPRKCPDCDEPGLIYTWKAKKPNKKTGEILYQRGVALCACHPSKTGKTKNQLKYQGIIVMSRDFKGTVWEFEQENGLHSYPVSMGRAKATRFSVRVGMDLTPDARRFGHVPDNEKSTLWG